MKDTETTAYDAISGVILEEYPPQSANTADHTPAAPSPNDDATEGADIPSVEAFRPQPTDGDVPQNTDAAAGTVFLPVYNGKTVPIRADDTERVTALLRQGLRFEQFLPQFEVLRRMSRAAGMHRPEELIDRLQELSEEQEYRELLQLTEGNEELAKEVLAHRLKSRAAATDTAAFAVLSPAERLANEYAALKQALPQAPSFSDLPDEVIREAVGSGTPLIQCYLLYEAREQSARESAVRQAQAAAAASTGTLRGLPDEAESPAGDSFRKAFRNRL